MGLLWYQPSQVQQGISLQSLLRHEANHDDRLQLFGWNQHDGASYGKQDIVDPRNHVRLTVQWVHLGTRENDPARWTLRVTGKPIGKDQVDTNSNDLSLLWYVGTPGNSTAEYDPQNGFIDGHGFQTCIVPSDSSTYATYRDNVRNVTKVYNATYFAAFQVPPNQHFNPRTTVLQELRNPTSNLPPRLFDPSSLYRSATAMRGNQIVQQIFLSTPFQVDFHLRLQLKTNRSLTMSKCHSSWEEVTVALHRAQSNFQSRFEDTFINEPRDATRQNDSVSSHRRTSSLPWTQEQIRTAQYALGNLLSSISYMHGTSQIYDNATKGIRSGPLTAGWTIVPDRPDHAQGYLWDDGFHQQLVHYWDIDWTMEILKSWYDKTDEQGWIPRQMIIGDETRWSARPSSWPQVPGSANPPSHHWILQSMLRRHEQQPSSSKLTEFLHSIWAHLERNLEWYFRTQESAIPGLFRWEGRTTEYCLPSGMDDYPRAPMLTRREAHLDLHCWLIASCRAVSKVASALGMKDKALIYHQRSLNLTYSMLTNFWDDAYGRFDDFYINKNEEKTFVGHLGYLNFFPIFLDVLPTNDTLFEFAMERLLDRDNGMWTKYGLRSLSEKDPYYMKGDAYWTGLLWLNINYLAVSALFKYANTIEYPMSSSLRDKIRNAYQELRLGLMRLVVDQYVETGFIWEVYDAATGNGRDNHPFTGWSALIVNILAELY